MEFRKVSSAWQCSQRPYGCFLVSVPNNLVPHNYSDINSTLLSLTEKNSNCWIFLIIKEQINVMKTNVKTTTSIRSWKKQGNLSYANLNHFTEIIQTAHILHLLAQDVLFLLFPKRTFNYSRSKMRCEVKKSFELKVSPFGSNKLLTSTAWCDVWATWVCSWKTVASQRVTHLMWSCCSSQNVGQSWR